eukprot:CAMPEP_0171977548 /NCGR_PEP_ID=MMETSP0993-20121228/247731_1 /TAXON_ID=483369 /ORGANISM="non described non described, Strain CCMP2098" /LENGTH=75 /DNA_ID=CAMNT_0012629307 /DNA_START=41 /DNA_END=265 /DNA_ORIENTATION=-
MGRGASTAATNDVTFGCWRLASAFSSCLASRTSASGACFLSVENMNSFTATRTAALCTSAAQASLGGGSPCRGVQ